MGLITESLRAGRDLAGGASMSSGQERGARWNGGVGRGLKNVGSRGEHVGGIVIGIHKQGLI